MKLDKIEKKLRGRKQTSGPCSPRLGRFFFSVWGREFRNYRNGAAEATCTLLVCKITKVQCVLYVILIQALSNYNTVPGQLIQIVPYSTI